MDDMALPEAQPELHGARESHQVTATAFRAHPYRHVLRPDRAVVAIAGPPSTDVERG
jgi:hypothetical protein